MELTVGILKKVIAHLDDDILLADLKIGNNDFYPFGGVKRLLIMQADHNWNNKRFLVINSMGSHFSGEGKQEGLKYTGVHFDERNIK